MTDLQPLTALGGTEDRCDIIGTLTLSEKSDLSFASLATRRGVETGQRLRDLLTVAAPGPGRAALTDRFSAIWMSADQWLVSAPFDQCPDIAAELAKEIGPGVSITDQTDAWVVFDLAGVAAADACERLCAVPVRQMEAGHAQRTTVHQMGCFLICFQTGHHVRFLAPRSSAASFWHALETAARSVA